LANRAQAKTVHHRPQRRRTAGFGWRADLPDARDHYFSALPSTLKKLPARVDLRSKCPPVYDQGHIGSCTGNAIAGAIEFERRKAGQTRADAGIEGSRARRACRAWGRVRRQGAVVRRAEFLGEGEPGSGVFLHAVSVPDGCGVGG